MFGAISFLFKHLSTFCFTLEIIVWLIKLKLFLSYFFFFHNLLTWILASNLKLIISKFIACVKWILVAVSFIDQFSVAFKLYFLILLFIRLLYAGHGIMGLGHVIKQGQALPQHTLNCTLIQGDGTLKTFTVPFHCALRWEFLHALKGCPNWSFSGNLELTTRLKM